MDIKLLIRRFLAFAIDWNIMFGVAMVLSDSYFVFPARALTTESGDKIEKNRVDMGLAHIHPLCLVAKIIFPKGRRTA